MTKYQVRINVYFEDKTKADNLFKYLEGLKTDLVKFVNAADVVDVSKVDLIENEHDGEVFSPCTLLKSFENDSVNESFIDFEKTLDEDSK